MVLMHLLKMLLNGKILMVMDLVIMQVVTKQITVHRTLALRAHKEFMDAQILILIPMQIQSMHS